MGEKRILYLRVRPKCEASMTCLALRSSSTLGLKMVFLLKKAVFSPNVELDGIARQVVEASRLGNCACFGN